MDQVQAQDHMAWETQGPVADRTHERLATSDRGVVLLREVMKREIANVRQGLDPLGLVRDSTQDKMIDTKLEDALHGPETQHHLRIPSQKVRASV
jgi:5,5'-dehydrodivanillate O-demethylase